MKLKKVLGYLDLKDGDVGGESGVRVMEAALEVSGTGIVLWDDFWRTSIWILSGATQNGVLGEDSLDGGVQGSATAPATGKDPDPIMITQFRDPPLIRIGISGNPFTKTAWKKRIEEGYIISPYSLHF